MDNIIFRKSWLKTLSRWDGDKVQEFINALQKYLNDEPVELNDGRVLDLWEQVLPLLDSDRTKWMNKVQANRVNGKSGGRPKNPPKPTITQQNPVGFTTNNLTPETESIPIKRISIPKSNLIDGKEPNETQWVNVGYFGNPKNHIDIDNDIDNDIDRDRDNENDIDNFLDNWLNNKK